MFNILAVLMIMMAQQFLPLTFGPVMKPPQHETFEWRGVNVLLYGNWYDTEGTRKNAREVLNQLQYDGVNAISITYPFYQSGAYAVSVYRDYAVDKTPTNDRLAIWIEEAHKRGMKVMLRPLMDEQTLVTTGHWRGSIVPTDTFAWFLSYQDLIVGYARFAEEHGVEMFNIGSELNSLESSTDYWLALIENVKEVYSGKLIYSANWGVSERVEFWKELDYIGLDAFFNLEAEDHATTEELVEAWQPWIDMLERQQEEVDMPIIFTEIGTQSAVGSYREPWKWVHDTEPSEQAQAAYYAASCQAVQQIPEIVGLSWWAFRSEMPPPDFDPETDMDYSPLLKQAEVEMRFCYLGHR